MAITVPGFVVVVFVLWYSLGVWRSTDRYFRDEYKNYLKKEIENNKYIKEEEIKRLLAEKEAPTDIVKDGLKSDPVIKKAEVDKNSEIRPSDGTINTNKFGDLMEAENKYIKKIENSIEMTEEWEDDNIQRSSGSFCNADKDELCKISVAKQASEKSLYHDHTDNEFCSMNGNSEDYCLP